MRRNEQRGGQGARRARRVLLCAVWLGVLLISGCIGHDGAGGGASDPAAPGQAPAPLPDDAALAGSWRLQPAPDCSETLALTADGRFAHTLAVTLGDEALQAPVAGRYAAGGATGLPGEFYGELTAQGRALPADITYCGEWAATARSALPLAALAQSGAFDPRALTYRTLRLGDGTLAWVGTDDARHDRFVFAQQGGRVRGFAPDDALGEPLFHRVPAALPAVVLAFGSPQVVNLPQQNYARSFAEQAGAPYHARLVLSVHSAVDVTFGRLTAPVLPLCEVVAWDTPNFTGGPLAPNPLADVATQPTRTLNPAAIAAPLQSVAATVAGQATTLYVVPIQVQAPSGAACELNIRARPLVARVAAEHLAVPGGDLFSQPLGGGPAYVLARPGGAAGRLRALPLARGGLWRALRLTERVVQPPAPQGDALGLRGAEPAHVRLTLQGDGDAARLTVTGSAGEVLGPLLPYQPAADVPSVAVPGSTTVTLDASAPERTLRFTLAAAALVEATTGGGVVTTATLRDGDGAVRAHAAGGAADGAGFRLVEALPPGSYDLAVRAAALPATFTLSLAEAPARGLTDPRLAACLAAATPPGAAPESLREADCAGRGIVTLAGVGAYAGLEVLLLDDNTVSDLAPLAGLTQLRVLSLAGDPVGALTPLGGLALLHRLSLARTGLDAAALAFLPTLAERLTYLNLDGSTGVAEAEVATLKASLPNALLIAPDGQVLE